MHKVSKNNRHSIQQKYKVKKYLESGKWAELMPNIDLVFLLQPIIVITFSVGLILYWRFKRSFNWFVLLYTLVAYAVAIILKNGLQVATAPPLIARFGLQSAPVAAY
jgi:hypothetical protein